MKIKWLWQAAARWGGIVLVLMLVACNGDMEKPGKGSEAYQKAVSDFYIALSAIQADRALFAVEKMKAVADRYPSEAAAWANLAVFAMRQGNFEGAEEYIGRAIELDGDNAEILFLAGILESRRGNVDASLRYLRRAADADPTNIKIAYALAEELERQDPEANAGQVTAILESIIEKEPDNLAVMLEMVRLAAKRGQKELLREAMARLSQASGQWPDEIARQFREVRQTILEGGSGNLTFELALLRNSLNQLPAYQADLAAVQIPPNQVAFLITDFSWLPQPSTSVAPADTGLAFRGNRRNAGNGWELAKAIALSDKPTLDMIRVKGGEAIINDEWELPFPGRVNSRYGVETIDYNYDFLNDLAFAGEAGFRLYRQQEDSTFIDITDKLGLDSRITGGSYYGSWSRDIDLDGDLDLVLAPRHGAARLLRNNGDGTFAVMDTFGSIDSPVAFLWADFDGDADSDAVFLDKSGALTLLSNERSMRFTTVADLPLASGIVDIDVADIDNDGNFDILAWTPDGISRLYYRAAKGGWVAEKLTAAPGPFDTLQPGRDHLYAADLDNNGANDLMITTPQRSGYWLNGASLKIDSTFRVLPGNIHDVADMNGDTRLDLLRLSPEGAITAGLNSGSKGYRARVIRPRASGPLGDQRINSFGIGGAIEIRSGLLYEKQLITKPWVHLGLGTFEEAELLRIIWPNGTSQTEFAELGYGSQIFNEQILKGSCPWLFAYNGSEMAFVTDFIWRSPLGLRINAQSTAGVVQTEDRVLVRGHQLQKKDGYYELRITADLWETHFFDHISLMAVDHPADASVFIDERFAIPAPDLDVKPTGAPRPVASVTDEKGRDRTARIREIDRVYLDAVEHTKYQGVAEDHFIEIDLGEKAPAEGPLWLLAQGWVRPTDSSINYALSQGSNKAPRGLSVAVPDGAGGWKEVRSDLGFPAGKSKTVMIDLEDIFIDSTDRRLRLRTTTEIYWDAIRWAKGAPETPLEQQVLPPQKMELRYRGFSKITTRNASSPDLPTYQTIAGTTPKWYDLEGYYTRFGDVSELLEKVDDRYVIMNAGDEMVLRFKAPDDPRPGWTRDFVLIGDGWVKDGDYNTKFSETVRPLPSHRMDAYSRDTIPATLAGDPVFRRHREDWINYHTRYITPRPFRTALHFGN